jgi:hypothetical protein
VNQGAYHNTKILPPYQLSRNPHANLPEPHLHFQDRIDQGVRNANMMTLMTRAHRNDLEVTKCLESVITHMLRGTASGNCFRMFERHITRKPYEPIGRRNVRRKHLQHLHKPPSVASVANYESRSRASPLNACALLLFGREVTRES